jgi:hypothetical protein
MRESATAHVDATPAAVVERITDIARLPEWNNTIVEVVEEPVKLGAGAVWRVRLRAQGRSWVSKSTVLEFNHVEGRFRHRSKTDDGNPSFADWEWNAQPDDSGTTVTTTVDLHPVTFWRKHLLVHVRRPALRKEMQASLSALARCLST